MTQPHSDLHTIFGAGQIGAQLADHLLAQGHRVRLVRRGPAGASRPGLTWMSGDASDPAFALEACRGAAAVYNCTNVPYHRWADQLVPLYTCIREAAGRAGARLVVLDNLYMYGLPDGPMAEDTPLRPCSRKGEIRARLATELMDAHARGDVRATTGRASDFVGPGTHASALFRPGFFDRLVRGKPVQVVGDPDQLHSYTYTPDVAAALAMLGTHDQALGRVWHLPTSWHGTTRELISRFAVAAGVEPRLRRMPRWALRSFGLVSPLIGEVVEILYQFEHPFVIDDRRFRTSFGIAPTPVETLVATTLAAETRVSMPAGDQRAVAQE